MSTAKAIFFIVIGLLVAGYIWLICLAIQGHIWYVALVISTVFFAVGLFAYGSESDANGGYAMWWGMMLMAMAITIGTIPYLLATNFPEGLLSLIWSLVGSWLLGIILAVAWQEINKKTIDENTSVESQPQTESQPTDNK